MRNKIIGFVEVWLICLRRLTARGTKSFLSETPIANRSATENLRMLVCAHANASNKNKQPLEQLSVNVNVDDSPHLLELLFVTRF